MLTIETSDGKTVNLIETKNELKKNILSFNGCDEDFKKTLLRKAKILVFMDGLFCPSRFCGYVGINQERWDYLYHLSYGLDGTATSKAIRSVLGVEKSDIKLDCMRAIVNCGV